MTSRHLTQIEIDGYHRNDFVNDVLSFTKNLRTARFIVKKKKYNLVEIKQIGTGASEWEFSIGASHYYTYKLSDVIRLLESIYDNWDLQVIPLAGEIEIEIVRLHAHPDAEESNSNRAHDLNISAGWTVDELDPESDDLTDEDLDKLRISDRE